MDNSTETPQELFSKCREREEQVNDKGAWLRLKWDLVQGLVFRPLLSSLSSDASRYLYLVQLLKKCSDNEARLLVLARWLKEEGVCEPKDFLPQQLFQKVTSEARQRAKAFSPTDWRYRALINAWMPYFERLIEDLHHVEKKSRRVKQSLMNAGYDQQAIQLVIPRRKRVAIPAVCEWLAIRGIADDARTLQNAYSRLSQFASSQQL